MKPKRTAITAAAAVLALSSVLFSPPAPVFAQANVGAVAEPVTEATPPPGAEIAELSPAEESFLESNGVEGEITVQQDDQGAAMYLDGEGDWVITLPAPETQPGEPTPPRWGAGICVGNFYGPKKVGSNLEWGGGNNSCTSAPPNAVYPHYLDTMLRDTCQGFGASSSTISGPCVPPTTGTTPSRRYQTCDPACRPTTAPTASSPGRRSKAPSTGLSRARPSMLTAATSTPRPAACDPGLDCLVGQASPTRRGR